MATTLQRPKSGRVLAGVCAALANGLGWNVATVRILWIVLSLFPGPMWVVYALLWVILPAEGSPRR